MSRKVLVALAVLLMTAAAQVSIVGVIQTTNNTIKVDSIMFKATGQLAEVRFPADFGGPPDTEDSSLFLGLSYWPDEAISVVYTANSMQQPLLRLTPVVEDSWYSLRVPTPPPSPQIKFFQFNGVSEEGPRAFPAARATAFPNPFARLTTIRYSVRQTGVVRVAVHDLTGKVVRTLFAGTADAGKHSITWDGTCSDHARLPSGVYIVTLATIQSLELVKLTLAE